MPPTVRHAPTERRSTTTRGPIVLLAHQTRYELVTAGRNPRAWFLTLLFPVILLVIFAGVFHGSATLDGENVKLSRFFTVRDPPDRDRARLLRKPGGRDPDAARDRVLKRRRATPVPAAILIGAQAIIAVVTVAVMTTIMLVIAKLPYGVGIAPGAVAATACTVTLGALAFAAIGYAIAGLVRSPDAAQPIVQLTTMPLWFLSGVFISTHSLTGPLRTIGEIFPVEHLAAGLHSASIHPTFTTAISTTDLLVLAAWGIGAALLAASRFTWLPSRAAT